jgi:hypothetical protein
VTIVAHELPTSLGPPLVHRDGVWVLDLTNLPIVHGLSVLSRALAEMVVMHARGDRFDVVVERRLRSRENPELADVYGIELVRVQLEPEVVAAVLAAPDRFERRLRALLGSLQRSRFREALLPACRADTKALVAEFADGDDRQLFVLEQVAHRERDRGALRIHVEHSAAPRFDLATRPSLRIADIADRQFIAGSTRIAETWTEALRREAERGRRSFREGRSPHSHLFRQLDQAGLAVLQRVSLQWSEAAQSFLLESVPAAIAALLKRVLLACEDRHVRDLLAAREAVRIDAGVVPVWLDLAQLGRVLELSLGQRRDRGDVTTFLRRMPCLASAVDGAIGSGATPTPLVGVRVFLVHHMTAEIVGLIAALRALGCRDLVCLFVTYAGEPPASYLDAVLDLPPEEFRALALVNVPTPGHVEGHYRLSEHYSQLDETPAITAALRGRDRDYLPAMRAVAIVPFLQLVARAEAAGDDVLLVEDGGYLGPPLHEALLRDASTDAFAATFGHAGADPRPLRTALGQRLLATVEHTRNGFDRLAEVQARHGRLAVPAYSIAISHRKRHVESREVAASILTAIETVLQADGRILARRSCLVFGCEGAIGSELVRAIAPRLDAPHQLAGVDLRPPARPETLLSARSLAELPAGRWLATELVIGVTGCSILTAADVEKWLTAGERDTLVLVSGSTKKVEFRELMVWLDELTRSDAPCIAGRDVAVQVSEMLDPRTTRLYGHRWQFTFAADGRCRTILALGNLTPINFLFYGVATEMIDEVLTELATLTLGAVANARGGGAPQQLLAVDRDVDAHARPLPGP